MKKRHHSISRWFFMILVFVLAVNLAGGCFSLNKLEQSNMDYIYHLTKNLMNTSIQEMESQISEIKEILYEIVVSDQVQKAGSALIELNEQETPSVYGRSNSVNEITERIQQGISSNHFIVCAAFLEPSRSARSIATTQYFQISDEMAEIIREQAEEAEGETIFMDGEEVTGEKSILVMAKQCREKKNLSMKNIGVVVLFVDMERLGSILTEKQDGIFVLKSEDGELSYILDNDSQNESENEISDSENEIPELENEDYAILEVNGRKYYSVKFQKKTQFFSYRILTPYDQLFEGVDQTFRRYLFFYMLSSVLAGILAIFLAGRISLEIWQFIRYIRNIPKKNSCQIPIYEKENIRSSEVYELKAAFNSMSVRLNELIHDNYQKQLIVKESQLQALQSQINPHFLYNTLNSIYWMTKTNKTNEASEMISSLALLLREAVSNHEFVISIDRELDILCHYFIIQKYRYEERLKVEFEVSEECGGLTIPKFTLQPLAENSIAYGLEEMLDPCMVKVKIFREGNDCICQVINEGPAPCENLMDRLRDGSLTPKGSGVGLLNIEKKIKTVYGEPYGVSVFREGTHTIAQVMVKCIPIKEYKNGENVPIDDCG